GGLRRRPHPQGREACRSAGAGTDQVRPSHQPQDRQRARPRNPAVAARPRRRGDRMMRTEREVQMKLPHRRQVLHLAASAAALPAVSRIGRAQAYPTRPVHVIVGFTAGNNIDIVARLIGQWLSERLRQPFIIVKRPAASGNIAAEAVVRAAADGHTLLMTGTFNAINATLYENLSFNFIRDIAPVAGLSRTAGVMEVSPSFPAKTVPEFIAYARANPRNIMMASGGPGSAPGLYG